MLPRELIEELVGRPGALGLHVLQTLPDRPKGLLIILSLPFEVFGQDVVEGVGAALSTPPRKHTTLPVETVVPILSYRGFDCSAVLARD